MKIGTDVNLSVCKAEGYIMMEYNARKLVKKGKLDKDESCHFTATSGYLTHDGNGKLLPKSERKTDIYILDAWLSWNDVFEIYERDKDGIWVFGDYDNCAPNFDNPTPYDLLAFADTVNAYSGLN